MHNQPTNQPTDQPLVQQSTKWTTD